MDNKQICGPTKKCTNCKRHKPYCYFQAKNNPLKITKQCSSCRASMFKSRQKRNTDKKTEKAIKETMKHIMDSCTECEYCKISLQYLEPKFFRKDGTNRRLRKFRSAKRIRDEFEQNYRVFCNSCYTINYKKAQLKKKQKIST